MDLKHKRCGCGRNCVSSSQCPTSGKYMLYTGPNIDQPFSITTGMSFDNIIIKLMRYLDGVNVNKLVTVTISVTPDVADVFVNGVGTYVFTASPGEIVDIVIESVGYKTYTTRLEVPDRDYVFTVDLVARPDSDKISYYWGEVGNIYSETPSGITQNVWDNYILPNGSFGGFSHYVSQWDIQDVYERVATGHELQWWMLLVDSARADVFSEYRWFIFDELVGDYVEYVGDIYTGTLLLDGILYWYTAIRPSTITKIKFTK